MNNRAAMKKAEQTKTTVAAHPANALAVVSVATKLSDSLENYIKEQRALSGELKSSDSTKNAYKIRAIEYTVKTLSDLVGDLKAMNRVVELVSLGTLEIPSKNNTDALLNQILKILENCALLDQIRSTRTPITAFFTQSAPSIADPMKASEPLEASNAPPSEAGPSTPDYDPALKIAHDKGLYAHTNLGSDTFLDHARAGFNKYCRENDYDPVKATANLEKFKKPGTTTGKLFPGMRGEEEPIRRPGEEGP